MEDSQRGNDSREAGDPSSSVTSPRVAKNRPASLGILTYKSKGACTRILVRVSPDSAVNSNAVHLSRRPVLLAMMKLPVPAPCHQQTSKGDPGSSQTTASTWRPPTAALLATLLLALLLYPFSYAPCSARHLIKAGPLSATACSSRSSHDTRKIRVAVYDSFWEHYG